MRKLIPYIISLLLSLSLLLSADQPLSFSHSLHVVDMEIPCSQCHEQAEVSTKGSDDLFNFGHDACYDCHYEAIDESCDMCHNDTDEFPLFERVTDLMPDFSHAMHIEKGLPCVSCHEGIEEKESDSEWTVSAFSTCIACHEETGAEPRSHTLHWETLHGRETQGLAENECSACHTENSCLNCHEGDNLAFQMHPQNFLMLHKNEFLSGKTSCETCHENEDCSSCHRANALRPLNHSSANWLSFNGGGNHALRAVSRIEYCLTCHEVPDEDPLCTYCHK